MFNNCIPQQQLDSCSKTHPSSLLRVCLARLVHTHKPYLQHHLMHACLNLSAYRNSGSFFSLQHVWVNGYLVPPTLLMVCKHVMSYYHGNTLGQGSLIKAATWCLFCTSEWFCVILTSLVPRSPPFFCFLVCVRYDTRKRKSGEKWGRPENTYHMNWCQVDTRWM